MARAHDRGGEDPEGGRVRFRVGRSVVRVPAAERGAASKRDPATGCLHDTGGAGLPHHRIRRIWFLTVSGRSDMYI